MKGMLIFSFFLLLFFYSMAILILTDHTQNKCRDSLNVPSIFFFFVFIVVISSYLFYCVCVYFVLVK